MASLRYHALFVPYVVTIAVNSTKADIPAINWLRSRKWLWSLVIATLIYYAVRMVMYFPHGPVPMVYDRHCYLYRGLKLLQSLWE